MKKKLTFIILLTTLCIAGYSFYGVSATAIVSRENNTCPLEAPIQVTLSNYTFKRMVRAHISMEMWVNNISENKLDNKYFTFNKAVPPFRTAVGCFADDYLLIRSDIPHSASPNSPLPKGIGGEAIRTVIEYNKITKGAEIVIFSVQPDFI